MTDTGVDPAGEKLNTWGIAALLEESEKRPIVVSGGRFALLSDVIGAGATSFEELFADWDRYVDLLIPTLQGTARSTDPSWADTSDVGWGVPTVDRPTVYCAGANYRDHALEMGDTDPAPPYHFVTPPGTLNVHGGEVVRPQGVEKLDWEVELAVVMGRPARHVAPERALDYVAGYTIANDISVRDQAMRHSIFGVDWMVAKNAEGLTPVGPIVVPAVVLGDPEALEISLSLNGDVMQHSSTRQLISGISEQISRLSSFLTLEPGDLVLTGTPAGTAAAHGRYLQPGDRLVAHIERIGDLMNTIVAGRSGQGL